MKYIVSLSFFAISFIISVFALSNILLPIFYTLPRIRLEKKKNNLIKKIPLIMLIWGPVTWTIALSFGLYYSINYYPNHKTEIYIGVGISLFSLLRRIGKRNKDMEDDFRRTFNEYLRDKEQPAREENKLSDQDYKERLTKITTESLSKTGVTAKEFATRLNTELGMDMKQAFEYATQISKNIYKSKIEILRNNFSNILSLTFSEKHREMIDREIDLFGKNEISLDEFIETMTAIRQLESEDWLTKAQKLKAQEEKESLNYLDTSLEFFPSNFDSLEERGILLQALGYHKDAIKDFSKTIEAYPNNFNIIYLRGCSYLSLCEFDRARDDINNAIQLFSSIAPEKQIQISKEKGLDSLNQMYQQSLNWIDRLKDSNEEILREFRQRNDKERGN